MNRREFVGSVASAAAVTVGGCSGRQDPDGSPTGTDGAEASPSSTETRSELSRARSALSAALVEFDQMSLFDGSRVVASERNFDEFDPATVAERAREAERVLDGIDTIEREGVRNERRGLRRVVRIVRNGRRLYELVRTAFRRYWVFERAYYRAQWEDAATHARNGREAVAQWSSYGKTIGRLLDEIENGAGPQLPSFSPTAWRKRAAYATGEPDTMHRTLEGFRLFSTAWPQYDEGFSYLDDGAYEQASSSFATAADRVETARQRFVSADANGAAAFGAYAEPLYARAGETESAFDLMARSAVAASEGESSAAGELRDRSRRTLREVNRENPLPKPALEQT